MKIDREFKALIPPLSREEVQQLEANLKAEGCRDPLVTWNDLLIDGHHRREICGRLNIPFRVLAVDFPNRHAAKAWIAANQLGRRNISDETRTYLLGMQYREEKASRGGDRRSEEVKISKSQTDTLNGEDTADRVASQHGVGRATVHRAAAFCEAVDEIAQDHGSDVKDRILAGDLGPKADVQRLAEKPKEQQQKAIASIKRGEATTIGQAIRAVERTEAAAEAKKIVTTSDYGVRQGDFREVCKSVADESVDLIFTDPPYDRKALPLYGDMARVAARVLKPGGSLICYLGQYQIDEVSRLLASHLRLWWILACIHTGQSARMNEYGVVVKWKPMLWFVKGTRGDKQTFVDDAIESVREKAAHDWQQGIVEASYYIDKLTLPGQMILDPFCGGGTTAVAAKQLRRRYLTCDVDPESVSIARKRIHDAAV